MITYCIDNKLGGVTSLNYNVAANSPAGSAGQRVIYIDKKEPAYARTNQSFPVEQQLIFNYSEKDNYYFALRKLHSIIGIGKGALILNYDMEMAMLDHFKVRQTTYQLVHDAYNVGLSRKYHHVVDVFICHNTVIYNELLNLFPTRKPSIFYLPHGVPVSQKIIEKDDSNSIRLVFLGRMVSSKGIFDLLKINDILRDKNISFDWICIGNGPELEELKRSWNPLDAVKFLSPPSNQEVLALCSERDVFVLPTKFEGSPVSLLETMSVGLVPVITKLPGGITDIVSPEIGFMIGMDDIDGFANTIEKLYNDRALLKRLSANCVKKIIDEFDVKNTAAAYHGVFNRYEELYKKKVRKKMKVGSRLDQFFYSKYPDKIVENFLKSM